jgi:outer membrane protein assembly factor BamB
VLTAISADSDTGSPRRQQQRRRRGGAPRTMQEFVVLAVSRDTGDVIWRQTAREELPHEGRQANNSWASASAITDGTHVIASFGSRGLYCYDMEGTLIWERDLGDMRTRGSFGEGSSPALFGNTVVVTWDHEGQSFIIALEKTTGEELWRKNREEPTSWATPLIVEHAGRHQVVTPGTNRVRSYDLETGELIWQGDGLTPNAIPSPVTSDGIVYLMSGYRGNALQAVSLAVARGEISGTDALLWEHDRDSPYVPSPLLYRDTLYFLKSNNGILSAFDVSSGTAQYGPVRLEGISEVYASPVGAAGRVYILGRDGNALVLADGPELIVLARNSLDDGFDASPAIVADEMYLRGYRYLYRISEH